MELPVFELVFDEQDEKCGLQAVALVNEPAIQRNFLVFSKEEKKYSFAIQSEEQRILSGPLMIPDLQMFRKAEGNRPEHYVFFTAETIKNLVYKFFKQGSAGNVNLMHNENKTPEGVVLFESFILDSSRGIKPPNGFEDLPEGTWFGSYKVFNDEVWQQAKTNEFKGFSVEGIFSYETAQSEEEAMLQQVIDILKD